jgi:O-antigen/teichoic acid export membrane protein
MIKSTVKFLIKDSLVYGIGNAVSRFVQIITLLIIGPNVTKVEFNSWNNISISGSILAALIIFGMDSAVIRYYYDDTSEMHKKKVFTNGLLIQFFLAMIVLSVLLVGLPAPMLGSGNNAPDHATYIAFLCWVPANVFTLFFQNWFKWTFQKYKFISISFGVALINLLLLIYFLQTRQLHIRTIVYSMAISQAIVFVTACIMCAKYFYFHVDKVLIRKLLWYGAPMMLIMLFGTLRNSLDRIFLNKYLTPDSYALYNMAQKIGMLITLFIAAFDIAFGPMVFSMWDQKGAKGVIAKFQSYYLLCMLSCGLVISASGKLLVVLFGGRNYEGAEKMIPILTLANIIYGLYSFASIGISYSKKSYLSLVALAISVTLIFSLNILLVKYFFQYAVAVALIAGNLLLVILGYYFSKKYYKIPFQFAANFWFILLVACIIVLLPHLEFVSNIYLDAALKIAGGMLVIFVLSRFIFYKGELRFLKTFLERKFTDKKLADI